MLRTTRTAELDAGRGGRQGRGCWGCWKTAVNQKTEPRPGSLCICHKYRDFSEVLMLCRGDWMLWSQIRLMLFGTLSSYRPEAVSTPHSQAHPHPLIEWSRQVVTLSCWVLFVRGNSGQDNLDAHRPVHQLRNLRAGGKGNGDEFRKSLVESKE